MGGRLSVKRMKSKKDKTKRGSQWKTREERCYESHDRTLRFTTEEDVLNFENLRHNSRRAKMSCGHAVTPTSLNRWCLRLLDRGECKFVCGQGDCCVVWPLEEVCKMALLTPEEIDSFEKRVYMNGKNFMGIKECPGCKSDVVRNHPSNLNVECNVCSAARRKIYRFCWQCLKEWKGPAPRWDRCENEGCQNPLDILRTCPEIVFIEMEGVGGCPCTRACPTCGWLLEHNKSQCKSMVCPRCRVKFCFVCLSFSENCLQQNTSKPCPAGIAPRQTSIPVWQMA